MKKSFRDTQLPKWEALINEIFPYGIPERCEWTNLRDILNLLYKIGQSDALNHTFFPGSGGLDLLGARTSHEKDCIELNCGSTELVKPRKLIFQSFPEGDLEWAYFRLVTDTLSPSGVYESVSFEYEELTELTPGNYVPRSAWDANWYNDSPLPQSARLVSRFLKGDFAIFSKASLYNANTRTYDGRHDSMGDKGFRDHIALVIDHLKNN